MIIVNGNQFKTLKDKIYANNKQVREVYVNGVKCYPDYPDNPPSGSLVFGGSYATTVTINVSKKQNVNPNVPIKNSWGLVSFPVSVEYEGVIENRYDLTSEKVSANKGLFTASVDIRTKESDFGADFPTSTSPSISRVSAMRMRPADYYDGYENASIRLLCHVMVGDIIFPEGERQVIHGVDETQIFSFNGNTVTDFFYELNWGNVYFTTMDYPPFHNLNFDLRIPGTPTQKGDIVFVKLNVDVPFDYAYNLLPGEQYQIGV